VSLRWVQIDLLKVRGLKNDWKSGRRDLEGSLLKAPNGLEFSVASIWERSVINHSLVGLCIPTDWRNSVLTDLTPASHNSPKCCDDGSEKPFYTRFC